MGKQYLYLEIWQEKLPYINEAITNGTGIIEMDPDSFFEAGNRGSSGYGFRLDIENGYVPSKAGSAVARDLKEVLDDSLEFQKLAKNKNIVIRMGRDFELEVRVIK